MDKIVMLSTDRPRPRRSFDVPQSGARILFFTGVRYCRDSEATEFGAREPRGAQAVPPNVGLELALDLAAH